MTKFLTLAAKLVFVMSLLFSTHAIAADKSNADTCQKVQAIQGVWKFKDNIYTFKNCTLKEDFGAYSVTSTFSTKTFPNGRIGLYLKRIAVSSPVYNQYLGTEDVLLLSLKGSQMTFWGVADETQTVYTKK